MIILFEDTYRFGRWLGNFLLSIPDTELCMKADFRMATPCIGREQGETNPVSNSFLGVKYMY